MHLIYVSGRESVTIDEESILRLKSFLCSY